MSTEPAPSEAPPVGTRLRGQYELTRFLGAGGMGAVYEALTPNGERVAVKVLLRGLGSQAVERFKREAHVTSTLDGPHVVTTLDAGIDPVLGIPFMVMPLLVGLDLQELIDRIGPVHPTAAVTIVRQAALALAEAHASGIVHRDIKPANLYLQHEPSGRVTTRVLDFGIARCLTHEQAALTSTGTMLGTPRYMAPEQAMSTRKADRRADVWSLAATLYHALTARAPFDQLESIAELYVAITTTDAPMVQELAAWVDPGLATVLHGALIRDPEARCPSASAFAEALAPFTFGSDIVTVSMLAPMVDEILRLRPPLAERPSTWREIGGRVAQPTVKLTLDAEAMDPLVGQTLLGRYSILRRIGRGGMGSVYEAACADGRRVAIKVIDPERAGKDEAVRRRFVREVRAVSSIHNDNVVRILDADTDPSQQIPFVVMELLRGSDLGAVIARHGALPAAVVTRIFLQACRGLEAAHRAGLIHRDIKPANLFLHAEPSGEIVVKICDFGIAKHVTVDGNAPVGTASLTRTGGVVGSPMYMSPEQAKGAKAIDLRTDIWSLGVSLYQALSGCEPWGGRETMGEVLVGILTEPVPHIQDRAPWILPELAAAVHRALTRAPEGRYGSVSELAQALAPFAGERWSVLPSDLEPMPVAERSVRAPRAELPETTGATGPAGDPGASAALGVTGVPSAGAAAGAMGSAVTGAANLAQTVTPGASRSGSKALLVVALAAVAGVGTALAVYASTGGRAEPAPSAEAAGSTVTAEPSGKAESPVETATASAATTVQVTIVPEGAKVTVDGEEQHLGAGGKLRLTGSAGQSFVVVVEHEGRTEKQTVVLTADGKAVPGRIELVAAAASAMATAKATGASGAGTAAPPPPTKSVKMRETW